MTLVAAIGLAVNGAVGLMLRESGKRDLNVRAALFHVFGDALGGAAVIIGGIVIAFTHRAWIDPVLSLFVAAIIVVGVVRVMRDATDVLLESVPSDVNTAESHRPHRAHPGVAGVHDLHVWSIASGSHSLSAHVLLDDRRLSEATAVLREIDECVKSHFGIAHLTIQFECHDCPVTVRHLTAGPGPRRLPSRREYWRAMSDIQSKTVVIGMARTPFGKLGGALAPLSATTLGAVALTAAIERSKIDPQRSSTYLRRSLQAGVGQNPARQVSLKRGSPKR